ncbi:MAG TPA: hypothetical protein PKD54_15325, partial [Pirellulaceae bacterium]|nr:hypothetical protein [Pirellulaceae bacterium]
CDDLEPLPEALKILKRLPEIRKNIGKADSGLLNNSIAKNITSLTVGVRNAQVGEIRYREFFGELAFHAAFEVPPIPIPDTPIGHRHNWMELAEMVRQANRPLHLRDFYELIGGDDPSHAAFHVRRAERAGLIKNVGHQGGWVQLRSEMLFTMTIGA